MGEAEKSSDEKVIVRRLEPLAFSHPNPALLEEPEAMLVINVARTILHYLDEKLRAYAP
jgi:hypothetical protein